MRKDNIYNVKLPARNINNNQMRKTEYSVTSVLGADIADS